MAKKKVTTEEKVEVDNAPLENKTSKIKEKVETTSTPLEDKTSKVKEKAEVISTPLESEVNKPREITLAEIFNILSLNIENLKVGIKGVSIENGIIDATLTLNIGREIDAITKNVKIKNITSVSADLASIKVLDDPNTSYVLEKNSNIYKSITRKISLAIENESLNKDNILDLWN